MRARSAIAIPALSLSFVLSFVLVAWPVAAKPAARAPAPSLLAGLEMFQLDGAHSIVDFTVPWMGVSRVRGTFGEKLGTLVVDSTRLTNSSLTLAIAVASLSTGHEQRDKHLKSPDFFDAAKFPYATFTSTSIVPDGEGFRALGNLTIHGVTKPVEVPFRYNGRVQDLSGGERIGFEGTLRLDRRDFGVVGPARFNAALATGLVVGNDVELALALEGFLAPPRDTLPNRAADSLRVAIARTGMAKATRAYRAMRDAAPDSLRAVDEEALNALGYWYLAHDRADDALAIFGLEAETYPDSRFAHTGLGQAWATAGDAARAASESQAALGQDPPATRATEILRRASR
jgi:polyisoprenoid-binding protein YceI